MWGNFDFQELTYVNIVYIIIDSVNLWHEHLFEDIEVLIFSISSIAYFINLLAFMKNYYHLFWNFLVITPNKDIVEHLEHLAVLNLSSIQDIIQFPKAFVGVLLFEEEWDNEE